MGGAIPPLPNTPSWRGAQLGEHRDNFTFYLLHIYICGKFFEMVIRILSVHASEI
jgi:hypothetical protein